MEEDTA
jgi:hypothetical protein